MQQLEETENNTKVIRSASSRNRNDVTSNPRSNSYRQRLAQRSPVPRGNNNTSNIISNKPLRPRKNSISSVEGGSGDEENNEEEEDIKPPTIDTTPSTPIKNNVVTDSSLTKADEHFITPVKSSISPRQPSLPKIITNNTQESVIQEKSIENSNLLTSSQKLSNNSDTLAPINRRGSNSFTSSMESSIDRYSARIEHFSEVVKQLDDIKSRFDSRVNDLSLGVTFVDKILSLEQRDCKTSLLNNIILMIKELTQNKIPEIYLRSIPKFGGKENMINLHKSLLDLKRSTTIGSVIVNENEMNDKLIVNFDSDTVNDLKEMFSATIDTSMENFIRGLLESNSKISDGVKQMKLANKQLEAMLYDLKNENLFLLERIDKLERDLVKSNEIIEIQKIEISKKDVELDIIKEQVVRRDKLLDEQRTNFLNELVQLQMKLVDTVKYRRGSSSSFLMRGLEEVSIFPQDEPIVAHGDVELSRMLTQYQQEMNILVADKFEGFRTKYMKERRKYEKEKREELERKDLEINELKKRILALERSAKEVDTRPTSRLSDVCVYNSTSYERE